MWGLRRRRQAVSPGGEMTETPTKEVEAKYTVRMPHDLRKRLKVYAARHDTTVNELILRWISKGLKNGEPQETP